MLVAYNSSTDEMAVSQDDCSLDQANYYLRHDPNEGHDLLVGKCDSEPGASGGPILAKIGREWRVVGINQGSQKTIYYRGSFHQRRNEDRPREGVYDPYRNMNLAVAYHDQLQEALRRMAGQ